MVAWRALLSQKFECNNSRQNLKCQVPPPGSPADTTVTFFITPNSEIRRWRLKDLPKGDFEKSAAIRFLMELQCSGETVSEFYEWITTCVCIPKLENELESE